MKYVLWFVQILLALAAFVAYGRWKLAPITPKGASSNMSAATN